MSIGYQLTPGAPSEVSFAAPTNLPDSSQNVILIGHLGTAPATGVEAYKVVQIGNVASVSAAKTEAETAFGADAELAKMVVAAVEANQAIGTFPAIYCIPLAKADTDFGQALTTLDRFQFGIAQVAVCYDAKQQALMQAALTEAKACWAPGRVDNGQFGCFIVAANQDVQAPATLFKYDTFPGSFQWLRDSAPTKSVAEIAAMCAAQFASLGVPFYPVRNVVIPTCPAPASMSDWASIGSGMESEAALRQGWCPLQVLPNGSVAHLRSRVLRVTTGDGVTGVTAYFDLQDLIVLAYWRKVLKTRYAQEDIANGKASNAEASLILGEVIRLGSLMQDQGMFQGMETLAKKFTVTRNAEDRSRFDVYTPVDVIPILAVVATEISATTDGDAITV